VVSVTTYRDAGFVPEAFINFLCLLGWSPKNDREVMSIPELTEAFTLEGINRANAVVNFSDADPFDPKAVWLNAEHIRGMALEELSKRLLSEVHESGFDASPEKMLEITPLVRERIKLLRDVTTVADFFFARDLPPYDSADLIPQKGDLAQAGTVLEKAREVLAHTEFDRQKLEEVLRAAAQELGMKAGPFFSPIRVAVTGKKNAPPLFETLEVLGRETTLARIEQAIQKIQVVPERS
jgi:glutamyl-tRNA synthetase